MPTPTEEGRSGRRHHAHPPRAQHERPHGGTRIRVDFSRPHDDRHGSALPPLFTVNEIYAAFVDLSSKESDISLLIIKDDPRTIFADTDCLLSASAKELVADSM